VQTKPKTAGRLPRKSERPLRVLDHRLAIRPKRHRSSIETHAIDRCVVLVAPLPEPLTGHANPIPLLAVHAAEAGRPGAGAAGADLDDDDKVATARDDVELEVGETQVGGYDREAARCEVGGDGALGANA
jgi:hypothetical protein